jgi:hypothetical protein
MKVAIYGDSHAAGIFEKSVNDDISYVEMLYHKYDVRNFGAGGSSLFYSYDQFLKTEEQYDKIVFLVTVPGRLYLNPDNHRTIQPSHLHVARGINQIDWYIENYSNSMENKKVFQTIKDYFLYVQNMEQELAFHKLMIQDIKRLRPDALIIETTKFASGKDTDFSFWNIDEIAADIFAKFQDFRHCHMSKEKHIILYEMIEENIKTGKDIDYNRLINVKPSKTFEEYFKSIGTVGVHIVPFEKYEEMFK